MTTNTSFCLAGLLVLVAACNRKDDEPIAGKGGNASLNIVCEHHRPPYVDSMTVYIKYNATELPQSFDDSSKMEGTSKIAHFVGLKKGKYYLYAHGLDRVGNKIDTISGGTPYEITEEKSIDLTMIVTDGD